ncbi:hypothetical protein GC089_17440 [Cellulomonas sp. JZ18]|uniref:hypothetical protein n=1 Tax=Cellulomonas sp. JZ18 TaxID=2654191 RepID=UPI0012D3C64F|nr:hypothetical protein [Cellulomonas sp. JZ18]QGQ20646.1 hypothetical protein GC089_17440 [Cellulomonas sp. JZ18]
MTARDVGAATPASRRRPVAWAPRVLAALAVVASGVVHLVLWQQGYFTGMWLRPLFLAQGVGGVVLGVLLLVWRSPLPLLGAVAYGAATLGGFVVATSPLGLFGVRARWEGWAEWVSAVTELVAVVAALWALRRERP